MRTDTSAKIVFELIGAIKSTEDWERSTDKAPMLLEERNRLERILERVPDDLRSELEYAISDVEEAYADMALLYGMKVAEAIRENVSRPLTYSQYTLDVMLSIEEREQLREEGKILARNAG